MTPDRTDANPDENAEHGVLEESGNLDTASITILGGHIAQVNVDLPVASDDDDLDDDVIEDEIPLDEADLAALDAPRTPSAAPADTDARDDIVHDPHVEQLPTGDIILEPQDTDEAAESFADDDVHDAEVIEEPPHEPTANEAPDAEHPAAAEAAGDESSSDAAAEPSGDQQELEDAPEGAASVEADEMLGDDEPVGSDEERDGFPADDDVLAAVDPETDGVEAAAADQRAEDLADAEIVDDVELFEADAAEPVDVVAGADGIEDDHAPADDEPATLDPSEMNDESGVESDTAPQLTHAPWVPAAVDEPADAPAQDAVPAHVEPAHIEPEDVTVEEAGASSAPSADVDDAGVDEREIGAATTDATPPTTDAPRPDTAVDPQPAAVAATEVEAAAVARPEIDAAPAPVPTTRAQRAATGVIGTIPLTRRSAHQADDAARAADAAARVDRAHALERVRTPAPEVALTSKRIGQIDDARESADLLTADRLLDPRQIARPEPEGLWQQLVYSVSRHRINLGDGRRARQRKDLDRRIAAPLAGGARFVPVLSRKGGVGKTTITSLLGMALADARDDRIIAVDANPDRGTLADRVGRPNGRTVRDLVRSHDEMVGYNDVSSIVARDATRLDVLASDSDPRVSEAFSDDDYRQVADVAAHYYSIVLTDTGTGIVHSVMGATLELADTLVIVAGLSVDEARLASETLTWLETNGYASRVRDAVVVLNNSRPGTPLVRESELEAHFRSRVRTVIRMPYDARIAAGSAITFRDLQPSTRQAARELAAAVVEGLRTPAAAA